MMTIKEGDRVMYAAAWGLAAPVPGTVEYEDTKNGRQIFGVEIDGGGSFWGYANQFTILERSN